MRKDYEGYKPTGIAWIPQIPEHWNWSFLSQVASEQKIKKPKDKILPVMSLSYGQIIRKKNIDAGLVPASYDNYQLISKGNIILRFTDLQNDHTSLRTGLVKEDGIITSAYTNIQPKINSVFLAYLLHSYDTMKVFYGMGSGVRQSIGFKDVRYLQIPVPPRKEQDQIVRFLDWKVSIINKLINIKQKEIEVLEEQRVALISQATHCGILKPSKLKESGFAWMGDIPVNWHIRRFSKVAVVRAKIVSPQEHLEDMQISPASIEKGSGRILYTQTVKEAGVVGNNHRFYRGQIIYSKIRPLLNKVAIAPFDGLCSTDMYPIETSLETRYLKYFMLSQNFLCQLSMTGDRVKMPRLNQVELASVFIAFPEDKKEQKEIADYLDKVCERIQASIECTKLYIAMLRELSARLIADAVTGKIDVRNITVPEYEHADEVSADGGEDESEESEDFNKEED
ncbi:MAG: restriction endonuclease subunit S [Negativicoccus succinicivorans]|uniref:restriction endonuclease subunit S n=1 Tax=Negativicoccus succinicivorans TaxID=620903 RepID=UPI00050DAF2D|nr:restriction endonuclease subunit S [Negativicoccus succinicivorans]KGF11744.1 hypothetical protein HMPREF1633_04225 [Tissierellia bacterium S5-A11]MDU1056201.1 restriction endonuclease subunit S [Negativicoccus succinicivorans]MDU4202928.1 restriction endonuclease subunit S [Negativicoccus succinicivorans]MDU5395547.1 restriction endonuclease subunit S [Negativicoccus succinicivorans]